MRRAKPVVKSTQLLILICLGLALLYGCESQSRSLEQSERTGSFDQTIANASDSYDLPDFSNHADQSVRTTDASLSTTDMSDDMAIEELEIFDLAIFSEENNETPLWLSQVGLYENISTKSLSASVLLYEPLYPLWSDGSEKQRWIRLPQDGEIDISNMDHWQLPVGTVFYKEFSQSGRRIETRVIARIGEGPRDYWMGSFLWSEDESDALFVKDGQENALGTQHDVPAVKACGTCHNGEPGRALGFSAFQLSGERDHLVGLTLAELNAAQRFSESLEIERFVIPGDEDTQLALGYLYANCGNCHNERGAAWPDTDLDLTLSIADQTPQDTSIYQTSMGVALQYFNATEGILRITPGDPERSAVYLRMTQRALETQMPPLGTERVHELGLELIKRWIISLSPE